MSPKKSPMVCDGYVKYEEAEVHRSNIMQDFQDNEKIKLYSDGRTFKILLVRNLSWVILVRDLTFCFILMVQVFCIFFSYKNIIQLYKFKISATWLKLFLLPKVIQVIG